MKFPNPFRLIAAISRSIWVKLWGYDILVDEDTRLDRLIECAECEHLVPGPAFVGDQCGKCTCFVEAKTLLAAEECPVKKWKRVWRRSQKPRTV